MVYFKGSIICILAFVVTFVFIGPVSKQMEERAEMINFNLRKSTILLAFGYDRLSTCIDLLTQEMNELTRQVKLTKKYTNDLFEEEVLLAQKENSHLLSQLKGDLAMKSASLLSNMNTELVGITNNFFTKKFQTLS